MCGVGGKEGVDVKMKERKKEGRKEGREGRGRESMAGVYLIVGSFLLTGH